jgi:RND family efflux transporter MFP subunit
MMAIYASPAAGDPIEGFTEPCRKVELAPAEPGILLNLSVREGDQVRKGQLLGALDCEALLISQQIAKLNMESHGRLDAAVAERNLRKTRLEKLQVLKPKGHASQEEVDRASADFEIAEANVLAAQEQLAVDALEFKRTEALIERRTLRSPMDGVITRIYHEEREFIMASSPTVLAVVQLNPLRIVFSVPLAMSTSLKVGRTVPITFFELGGAAEGQIEFVSPVVDAESGTVRVKVLVANPRGIYRSGVRCAFGKDYSAGSGAGN